MVWFMFVGITRVRFWLICLRFCLFSSELGGARLLVVVVDGVGRWLAGLFC